MNPCPEYQQELAANAALGQEPEGELALHLRSCSACSGAFVELRATAGRHIQTAARLPEPRSSDQLDAWFLRTARDQECGKPAAMFAFAGVRRLVLPIGATALLAGLLVVFFAMRDRNAAKAPSVVSAQPKAGQVQTTSPARDFAPTWQSFRQQGELDFLKLNSAGEGNGTVVAHYRIKDGYSELDERW